MTAKNRGKETFSLMVILLIPIAIAINIVGGQLTSILKIPVDLDMIGVILVGTLAGPIPAAVTGVLTNLINGIMDPTWLPYAFCSFFIGISSGLLSKHNMMNTIWKQVISGIVIALVATVTATPITVFFFGGSTGGGSSMIAAGLMATGVQIIQAVFSVYIVTECIGKLISVFVANVIIRVLPERTLVKYRFGEKFIRTNGDK
ncbi:MAG: ECF transporter S component [Lachnospiraceae bacterium]|nr:ECF transporter S component [Lachnospiraceae bacterium]MCI9342437.1 ECF transporter S component [Lachnospiraceae bacterium]